MCTNFLDSVKARHTAFVTEHTATTMYALVTFWCLVSAPSVSLILTETSEITMDTQEGWVVSLGR